MATHTREAGPSTDRTSLRNGTTPLASDRRRRWRYPTGLTPYLFLALPLAFLIVFTYIPVVNMFGYSFTIWNGLSPTKQFVGLDNYVELATRPELFDVLVVSLYYVAASVVQIGLALYFATVLSFKVKFKSVFKGILFFPYLINGVAIGMIFLYFFQPGGTLDETLRVLGLQGLTQQWLGDPDVINVSLAGTSVWRSRRCSRRPSQSRTRRRCRRTGFRRRAAWRTRWRCSTDGRPGTACSHRTRHRAGSG